MIHTSKFKADRALPLKNREFDPIFGAVQKTSKTPLFRNYYKKLPLKNVTVQSSFNAGQAGDGKVKKISYSRFWQDIK